jgi:hypothetical protein
MPPVTLSEGEPTESRNLEENLTPEDQDHPEWTPDTRYLRQKISKETSKPLGSTDNIPYALRSRTPKPQIIGGPRDLDTMARRPHAIFSCTTFSCMSDYHMII